jgi:hypothetical protein
MTDRVVVNIDDGTEKLVSFTPAEKAAFDAWQTEQAQARTADEQARAAIVYGNDAIDITNIATVKQYVQASRANLSKTNRTQADLEAQVDRNTRAILAILRKLV